MESSEMKRDKEWLKNEIEIMGSETSENYPHEQMVDRELVLNLIDQLDEPVKVVIPQFVADWWERDGDSVTLYGRGSIDKKCKLHLISEFYDRGLGDYLSKVEDWVDENDSTFLDLVNGKHYEVEKEKKYYIYDKSTKGYLGYNADKTRLSWYTRRFPNDEFAEQEIRDIDERYWPFAVEVAE